MESHERFGDLFQTQGYVLLRPSIDFKIKPEVIASFGYTFINSQSFDPYLLPASRNEHNIWEQILLKQKFGKVELQHRFRQEHRWVDKFGVLSNGDIVKDGSSFSNRFRYRFTFSWKFKELKNEDKLFLAIFDEFWVSQGKAVLPENFSRNWMYFGLGYAFTDNMNFQSGFMHLYDRAGEGAYIYTPIWQTTFVYNF